MAKNLRQSMGTFIRAYSYLVAFTDIKLVNHTHFSKENMGYD